MPKSFQMENKEKKDYNPPTTLTLPPSSEVMRANVFQRPWRIFSWEAFLFSLCLVLGVLAAFKINKILKIQEITPEPIPLWHFLLYFLLATLFVFLLLRFRPLKRGREIFFKGIFILTVFWGSSLFFSLWMLDFFALILTILLIFWWLKKPSVLIHNIVFILGVAGLGAILGLRISPWIGVFLLAILSIYDFIAVYKTKHMVKMAKAMIEAGTILALICPQRISDFKADLKEVKPGGKFLILGGGDVAFPLIFAASLIPSGILNSLIVATFALIGLFLSFWIFASQKIRRPIPALPPIALLSIIGFLITKII